MKKIFQKLPFSGASAESVLIHWETEDFFAAALAEDTKEEEVTEADDDSTEFVTADTDLDLEVLVEELTESTVPLDSSEDSAENHLYFQQRRFLVFFHFFASV